mmetsp:Transcript_8474/g.15974  ORF Transcript_8474/g.15974 Transcript_8474/m.15974 type:complete len:95 (+) Transcript_8474:149-433(+)|eukprot:CAMPEP_0176489342 /NCGR_PEP_ID=MMETSP0200_2-20121128/7230_1 /TAXON_ID=947934 /ORGANISM="Chaetoceros sp., Strain GSL56" /LENGTH=94 /DNA_ID=CAMNT_0017886463 /DNA_START=112 /DNA_END=396 /DNA_ORIENTATION=-
MARVLFVFALIIAAASAFVQPSNYAVSRSTFNARPEAPKMTLMEGSDIAVSNVVQNANLVAANVQDFGGYLFPVFGILSLAALILYLSPPLADE